ncbi:hypothetical protein EYY60_10595 [Flavobacterium zhairuonense]|uniref:DUF7738 domain-containing protein n=1 Tax=Flavobacterium zhairuonense TaxID=2493631 RepID=UPI001050E592|nr:hypothetical protein [Flavobacterium zhairuonense]KAF2509962.1 hypothetical protein EYY60_10595 [Flavobacterium zhairuonense]
MIKKLKTAIVLLLLTILNTQCQNMKTEKNSDVSQAAIKIDSCGLSYKGQHLELGTSLSEWEKVLGKPSRDTNLAFVWDDLGIAIDDWQNEGERGKVAAIYIFFINLDSREGKAGQLNYARDHEEITEEWKNNILNDKSSSFEENKMRLKNLEEENAPKNFIYPFTTYKGYVNLHGFPVGADMKVAEINSYRKDLPFSGQFGYVDQDIDGVNDSGNTTDTFGGDYRAPGEECKDGRLQYYELTYTATGALEYLKIGYERLDDYKYRKERDKDRKEREKMGQ